MKRVDNDQVKSMIQVKNSGLVRIFNFSPLHHRSQDSLTKQTLIKARLFAQN
jgi:hypothetical protein